MVGALAYMFSTLGTDVCAQIGRGKSGLVPLTVSRPLGHLRLCVGAFWVLLGAGQGSYITNVCRGSCGGVAVGEVMGGGG